MSNATPSYLNIYQNSGLSAAEVMRHNETLFMLATDVTNFPSVTVPAILTAIVAGRPVVVAGYSKAESTNAKNLLMLAVNEHQGEA